MSQLADITEIVKQQPLSDVQRGQLLFDLLVALSWDIEGVGNAADAQVYLEGESHG